MIFKHVSAVNLVFTALTCFYQYTMTNKLAANRYDLNYKANFKQSRWYFGKNGMIFYHEKHFKGFSLQLNPETGQ